jgi:hypothetical protein
MVEAIWALVILLAIAFVFIVRLERLNEKHGTRIKNLEYELQLDSIRLTKIQKIDRRISVVEHDIRQLPYTKLKEAERLSLAAKTIIDQVGNNVP